LSGLSLQVLIAILIFHVSVVASFFKTLGDGIGKIEEFALTGASFVFGFNVTATIILVSALVAVTYHFGIMQRIVAIGALAPERRADLAKLGMKARLCRTL
jgi:concentrative nucleoside transporter, CNT family